MAATKPSARGVSVLRCPFRRPRPRRSISETRRDARERSHACLALVLQIRRPPFGIRSAFATWHERSYEGLIMSNTSNELKNELKKSLGLLRTLRDEVRVKLHLGGMDVKEQWKKLEPHLEEVEKKAEDLTEASRAAVTEAVKRLQKVRSSLTGRS